MNIDTVLFDMGGTIEDIHYDRALRMKAFPQILAILADEGIALPGDVHGVFDAILARNAEYKAWSEKAMIESPPEEIWSSWNLRDFSVPADRIAKIAEHLAYTWETSFFHRRMRPDAASTLAAIAERGYKLGVISNTSSRTQVFRTLEDYGIADYFECVILSSIQGVRKPHRAIFEAALAAMGSDAESTAYVGDTLSRDVIGSKRAGYALAFQITSFLTAGSDAKVVPGSAKPDFAVERLSDIIPILDSLRARRDEA